MSFQIAVRYTSSGGSSTVRFRAAIESIPAWHDRLRNVVILNRDAFELFPSLSDLPDMAIYCDPPYLHSTRSGDDDGGYLHDFEELGGLLADQDDHARLAGMLARFQRARVVVSYYDDPRLRRLYPPDRWTLIDCARNKNISSSTRRGAASTIAPEVLLVNGPSLGKNDA